MRLPRKLKKRVKKEFGAEGYRNILKEISPSIFMSPGVYTREVDHSYIAGVDVGDVSVSEDGNSYNVNMTIFKRTPVQQLNIPIVITGPDELEEIFGNINED